MITGAHYITGAVNNARDGTNANDRIVILWNPDNGINDNLTDIIGKKGSSGTNNVYLIDCEMLSNGCNIGDNLSVRVINGSNDYTTHPVNVTVTGAGYDVADNLTLNSPPDSDLNLPLNDSNLSFLNIEFNCSFSDLDSNADNVTLYGNWSGGWHANQTISVSGNGSVVFVKNISEGRYEWNCLVSDDLGSSRFADVNWTFLSDGTGPVISSVVINESFLCGTSSYVRVNCTTYDELLEVQTVTIQANSPSGKQNYSASFLSGDTYYADILVDELETWNFTCIANDTVENENNLLSGNLQAYSSNADLRVFSDEIIFGNNNPLENEIIVINATVYNYGCSDANNFLTGFYNGDPDSSGVQINGNKTLNVSARSNATVNITWQAVIGTTNIFVKTDIDNDVSESNESNNKANNTINVNAWQEFYGNISADKILSGSSFSNLSLWINETNLGGNVFITDQENDVNWLSLQAIGRNISNSSTSNDFSDIDNLLNMTNFVDSVSIVFTNRSYENFLVHQRIIGNVPIINSTNNTNFKTGILWDSGDDRGDGEFSQNDKEDLIFVSKINKGKQGRYGIYDYEIRIPVRLREYNTTDTTEVYFYYDLV
jgi:hypothetical protein